MLPVLVAVLGGIIQFGMLFWAQNTLTQVVRDTGRWAATQQGCSLSSVGIAGEANLVAANSSLLGYSPSTPWSATDMTTIDATTTPPTLSGDTAVNDFTGTNGEGVAVAWVGPDPGTAANNTEGCPPKDNLAVYHVTIKIVHTVPVFFPGMQYLPGLGTNGQIVLSSTAQFRMEPAP